MGTSAYKIIEYPSKDIENKVDCELESFNNFKIVIIGKYRRWLADKVLPFVINEEKEISVVYTLINAIFDMNLHMVLGSVNLFNQYNKMYHYSIYYEKTGNIIFICTKI